MTFIPEWLMGNIGLVFGGLIFTVVVLLVVKRIRLTTVRKYSAAQEELEEYPTQAPPSLEPNNYPAQRIEPEEYPAEQAEPEESPAQASPSLEPEDYLLTKWFKPKAYIEKSAPSARPGKYPAEQAGPLTEKVEFAVFSPESITPESSFLLDVWAYFPHQYSTIVQVANFGQGCHGFH